MVSRRLPLAFAFLASLALSSCTMAFPVLATFEGGALTFVGAEKKDGDDRVCVQQFRILDHRSDVVWEFEAYSGPRAGAECPAVLPLAYGRTPPDAELLAPPRRLEPGRLYVIGGEARGDILEGAFVIFRVAGGYTIANIATGSPHLQPIRETYWSRRRDATRRATVPADDDSRLAPPRRPQG